MGSEIKQCQNCTYEFRIEPEDFTFYEKMHVPPPTWCPECRLQRRLVWRNEYTLYKRKCDAPGHTEELISTYAPEKPVPVYDPAFWWGDGWDAMMLGRPYDFSRPFLAQFYELMRNTPRPSLQGEHATFVRSPYSNWAGKVKDCYLITDADYVENSAYGSGVCRSKDCFDNDFILDSQLCYFNFNVAECYGTNFSVGCRGCQEVWFSKNCIGCTKCFGCMNLRNKSYYIFNRPYTKEEYEQKIIDFNLGSYQSVMSLQENMSETWLKYPEKYVHGFRHVNVTGDYIYNCKNTSHGFLITDAEDSKFVAITHARPTKDCYDYTDWGENVQRLYECMTVGLGADQIKFSHLCFADVRDIEYSFFCSSSSHLFGCAGLRKKSYCILNKQYSKEEYEAMVPKIIQHMNEMPYTDAKGKVYRYGEFFPPEFSPFAYNETIAQEYFTLTKDQAAARGYAWRGPEKRAYTITMPHTAVPDHIKNVPDSLLNEVISCAHEQTCNEQCTQAFRLIPQELDFYRKMNLPLPRLCPSCRHYQRIKQRNPLKLWHRHCMCAGGESENKVYQNQSSHFHGSAPCLNEFETSYSPGRKEIVYCEQCYQAEVV